ncbi:nuclear transport factor 2 family protein [Microbacterium sp. NPDC057944]|uniref:nuclear transport factor 2 family protein n=1 Tax=Microbacterium sp. NPDC057944 TaxID=3346286 RepID=UPI0036D82326
MTTPRIPEPIASFLTAVNGQDHDAFICAFTLDAFVDDWGTRYHGLDAIKTWSDRELLGAHGTFTAESVSVEGATVTVIGDWRSSFANGPSSFRFALNGSKIASMTIREG